MLTYLLSAVLWAQSAADAQFERARAAQAAGRTAEAEAFYRDYLKRYGKRPEVLANLGAILAQRESFSEAIRLYQEALKLDPSLTPLHANLGLAYFKQNQPAPAIAEFDLFLKRDPSNPRVMQLRAMALLEAERYPEAEQQYRALGDGDLSIKLGLATALLRQQNTGGARAILDPLLANGESAEIQFTSGQVLLHEGRLEEALAALEKARSLNPKLPALRQSIGAVYWRQRKAEQAIAEWRADLREQPRNFESLYTLGSALSLNAASRTEAEALLRQAVTLRPRNARANYQLGKLIWQNSKSQEAAQYLERATQADGQFREAFFLYGTVLKAAGRTAESTKAFARVKQLSEQEVARQRDLFSESQ